MCVTWLFLVTASQSSTSITLSISGIFNFISGFLALSSCGRQTNGVCVSKREMLQASENKIRKKAIGGGHYSSTKPASSLGEPQPARRSAACGREVGLQGVTFPTQNSVAAKLRKGKEKPKLRTSSLPLFVPLVPSFRAPALVPAPPPSLFPPAPPTPLALDLDDVAAPPWATLVCCNAL